MALRGNKARFRIGPHKLFSGVASIAGSGLYIAPANFNQSGRLRNFSATNPLASIPAGNTHPNSWVMANTAGSMSSSNEILGSGSFTGGGAEGLNALADLLGFGDITTASMQLVVSALASLVGSGTISSATLLGKLQAAAALSGDGTLAAAIGALAGILANPSGSGTISSAVPYATGSMAATLRGYSDLTPEGLRDAVWNALAVNFNETGTMGNKVNSASASGDPWGAIIDSGLTAQDIMQILLAVAAGKTSITDLGGGDALVKFRNIADTKDVVSANMESSERASVTLDVS